MPRVGSKDTAKKLQIFRQLFVKKTKASLLGRPWKGGGEVGRSGAPVVQDTEDVSEVHFAVTVSVTGEHCGR